MIRSSIRERWRCCGLAALVAVGGAVPSYCAQADAAVDAGATAAEIVDVLVGVIPVVGCEVLGLGVPGEHTYRGMACVEPEADEGRG